jgi:gliding motility-associated-like protein
MKSLKSISLLFVFLSFFAIKKSYACHPLPLVNFNQIQYIPGTGLQIRAASDSPTCGCAAYWLDMEIRCNGDIMNGNGLFAGVWDSVYCFPFYQSAQMQKPNCVVQDYPWVTVPDSILCPGQTYQYRIRENHNFSVGPWTPIMSYTMPGVLDTNLGHLTITADNSTASPVPFCASTQLGWFFTSGTGCISTGCNTDTTYQWIVISGEPINVPVNFSCDTCPYPIASPSITTTYALNMFVGDTNACGHGVYTQTPITVSPLPYPTNGIISAVPDCKSNVQLSIIGAYDTLQWQSSVNNGPFNDLIGEDSSNTFQSNVTLGTCYRVKISTQCATIYSDTICPTILVGPTAAFSTNPAIQSLNGVPITFTDNSTGNIVTWQWIFGDGDSSNIQHPIHTYQNQGLYTIQLIVTDANGCQDSITMSYLIVSQVIVPNVITPNGDGQNDNLVFKNLEFYDNTLKVFNRWGTLIFEKENYQNDWNGGGATEGTYFFILEITKDKDDIELHKGAINILK